MTKTQLAVWCFQLEQLYREMNLEQADDVVDFDWQDRWNEEYLVCAMNHIEIVMETLCNIRVE